jgi:hypothetical protein
MVRATIRTTGLAACVLALTNAPAVAETVHFLIAERPIASVHGDSYVLPLTDPAAIAHARALIDAEPGTLPSIVVADIAPGADGVNRDHLALGAPAWSWHVTEFVEFADFTAEVLDGWPTFVEQDVDGWIANTGGAIGFWTYTVVAELPAVPEPASYCLVTLAMAAFSRRLATQFRQPTATG